VGLFVQVNCGKSEMNTMGTNIKFNYLYRDAGNYKIYGEEIFSNPDGISVQEIETKIKAALIDGEFFEPEVWGIKPLRFDEWNDDLDHGWNEFESVEETNDGQRDMRSITQFIEAVSAVKVNL
jgi:hypothetical protein